MFFSPSSPPARLPDSVSSSTPNSGTFSAARTRLNYDQNHSKSRLSLKKKLPFPRSVGSLAEAADDVKEDIRFRGQMSGDRRGAAGGAVEPGQLKGWNMKQFYGQNNEDRSSEDRKEDVNDRINRVTGRGGSGSNKFGGGDFNLNFSHPEEKENDMLDTIDLSSPSTSPCTTPPPALEQKVLSHNIGFKVNVKLIFIYYNEFVS
jgi:hypothetical protein